MRTGQRNRQFHVEIVKPSHYDDQGYLIQWVRAFIPSNSLGCLYSLVDDVRQRKSLGDDVDIEVRAYDECHTVIPVQRIIRRIRRAEGRGVVFLAGVQSNQMPRAMDLARQFREAGIAVAIGGFHVSGCLAMLGEQPEELKSLQAMGVTLFAGEAEGRMEGLLRDVYEGKMQPVYNYLKDLPELEGQPLPRLPQSVQKGYVYFAPVDCGRGCPFQCSFCTIINVQGRRSRCRQADEIVRYVREHVRQGVRRFFLTDDNLARNRNWEAILDGLIALRETEGARFKLVMQVDTMSHTIPGFIEKAARAGCNRVFIGLENINPDNLATANKRQNHVSEYRRMLLAWRSHHALTYAGYILGMPADTLQSIERDIKIIQEELPVDILHFTMLTPLPGSADHKAFYEQGTWMDPDLNKYDLEHVTVHHPRMSDAEWKQAYQRAWQLYYTPEHIERLVRRAKACGAGPRHVTYAILSHFASYQFEHVHPMQCGLLRRKRRATRRPGLPQESLLPFLAHRAWETASTYFSLARCHFQLQSIRRLVENDPAAMDYTDTALAGAVRIATPPVKLHVPDFPSDQSSRSDRAA